MRVYGYIYTCIIHMYIQFETCIIIQFLVYMRFLEKNIVDDMMRGIIKMTVSLCLAMAGRVLIAHVITYERCFVEGQALRSGFGLSGTDISISWG